MVILKGGRSTAGKRVASSHTGSLAGNEALYSAAFEKAGIVEVKRLDELMPVAQTLMLCPPLKSGNIIVGGTGGGHMIVSTDAAEREGFCMPPFSPEAEEKKEALLYDFAPKGNPFEQAGTFIDNLDEMCIRDRSRDGQNIFTVGDVKQSIYQMCIRDRCTAVDRDRCGQTAGGRESAGGEMCIRDR